MDDIVVFQHLNEEAIGKIVDLMAEEVEARLTKMDYSITLDKKVRQHIAESGYDEVYGARPLHRTLETLIENRLAEEILAGNIAKEDTITITYDGRKKDVVFKREEKTVTTK